jgi:DNA-binding transcriptional LysR family regulator
MVTVAMATTDALLTALRNKEFDLVVAPMPSVHAHDLVEEHLFDDEFVVIARRGHRLTRRKQVRLPDLSRERWALLPAEAPSTRMVHRVFQENGLRPPRVAITSGALELRDYLVSTTDLLGYSSTRVAREVFALTPFAEIRVKELERVRRVGMFYRKDGYLSPAATRFVEVLSASASVIRGDG